MSAFVRHTDRKHLKTDQGHHIAFRATHRRYSVLLLASRSQAVPSGLGLTPEAGWQDEAARVGSMNGSP